jgi:hypothetical protein
LRGYPEWVRYALVGACTVFLAGPAGGVVLLMVECIRHGRIGALAEAGLLLVISVISGGAAGLAVYRARRLWHRGHFGRYLVCLVGMEGYLWTMTLIMLIVSAIDSSQLPFGRESPVVFCAYLHLYGIGLVTVVYWALAAYRRYVKRRKAPDADPLDSAKPQVAERTVGDGEQ